jgi:hypothetical protein
MSGKNRFIKGMIWLVICLCSGSLSSGCRRVGIAQTHPPVESIECQEISLEPDSLETGGLAFLTPSTVTGKEQERQAVAFLFARALREERPTLTKYLALPETINALNEYDARALKRNPHPLHEGNTSLLEAYRHMYEDYRKTGMFNPETLRRVGEATEMRYLFLIKLLGFEQDSDQRFGFFGLRVVDTKNAKIRLYLQIWDSVNGGIAWECMDELSYSVDTPVDSPITLREVVDKAAKRLIGSLPPNGAK